MFSRFLFLLALLLTATSWAVAEQTRVVLLENGGVLRGEVRLIGGTYLIADRGTEIRLPESRVRFIGDSLEHLVEQVRTAEPSPTIEGRLELAEWCGKQQLWGHAARELIAAQREWPRDARVVWAQRRLWHAREMATQAEQSPERRSDPAVQPASFDQPVPLHQSSPPQTEVATAINLEELPDGTVQDFTRQIQRILVNNCTTSGCHATGGAQDFQLNRDLLHGLASQRSTRANLEATLRAINAANPELSPLLLAMEPSHAGGRGQRLGHRQSELQAKVADWVRRVTGTQEEPVAEETADQETTPATGLTTDAKSKVPDDVFAPGYYEALLERQTQPAKAVGSPAAPQTEVKRGVQLKRAREPRDEFDPAIFNEQFGDTQNVAN